VIVKQKNCKRSANHYLCGCVWYFDGLRNPGFAVPLDLRILSVPLDLRIISVYRGTWVLHESYGTSGLVLESCGTMVAVSAPLLMPFSKTK